MSNLKKPIFTAIVSTLVTLFCMSCVAITYMYFDTRAHIAETERSNRQTERVLDSLKGLRPNTRHNEWHDKDIPCHGSDCSYGMWADEGPPCDYVRGGQSVTVKVLAGGSVWECAAVALKYTDEELSELVRELQTYLNAKAPTDRTDDINIDVIPPGWMFGVGYDMKVKPLWVY